MVDKSAAGPAGVFFSFLLTADTAPAMPEVQAVAIDCVALDKGGFCGGRSAGAVVVVVVAASDDTTTTGLFFFVLFVLFV